VDASENNGMRTGKTTKTHQIHGEKEKFDREKITRISKNRGGSQVRKNSAISRRLIPRTEGLKKTGTKPFMLEDNARTRPGGEKAGNEFKKKQQEPNEKGARVKKIWGTAAKKKGMKDFPQVFRAKDMYVREFGAAGGGGQRFPTMGKAAL